MKKASLEPTPKSLYLNRRQFIQSIRQCQLSRKPFVWIMKALNISIKNRLIGQIQSK